MGAWRGRRGQEELRVSEETRELWLSGVVGWSGGAAAGEGDGPDLQQCRRRGWVQQGFSGEPGQDVAESLAQSAEKAGVRMWIDIRRRPGRSGWGLAHLVS